MPGKGSKYRPFNPHSIPGVPFNSTQNQNARGNFRIQQQTQVFTEGYFGDALLRDKTLRESKIEDLTEEVFSKGNRYIRNCIDLRTLPLGRLSFPEVAICGNTHSGKSRLVSSLLHNPRAARPGRKAGTTAMLKFFSVGDSFMIVDTPGYGEWNKHYDQRTFVRTRAQAITKQYITLRKHSNLKRVYLCIPADSGLRHRDREFIRFLMGEGLSFTIVMTFLDALAPSKTASQGENNWKEIMAEIPVAAKRIFDALGTDQVPFIEVNARSGFNIDALQKDMVFQCCQDIERDEDINLRNFRELSYSPPSAAACIAAEARYSPEHELMIDNDDITDVQYIAEHREKLNDASRTMGKFVTPLASLESFARGTAIGAGPDKFYSVASLNEGIPTALEFSSTSGNRKNDVMPASRQLTSTGVTGVKMQQDGEGAGRHLVAEAKSTELVPLPCVGGEEMNSVKESSLVKRSEQPAIDLDDQEEEFLHLQRMELHRLQQLEQQPQNKNVPASSIILGSKIFTEPMPMSSLTSAAASSTATSSTSLSSSSLGSVVLTEFDESPALVQKAPQTLVYPLLLKGLKKVEKSPHRYKEMIENGWKQVLDDSNPFFLERHEDLGKKQSIKYRNQQIMRKYVVKDGLRRERALKLDAQGFMNPFVGRDAASGATVVGLSSSHGQAPSSVRGTSKGGRMLGLKRRGFGGGHAFSEHTFKGKGRSSDVFHKWAR